MMKAKKIVITSKNKKEGYFIYHLLVSKEYVYAFCGLKNSSYNSSMVVIFDEQLSEINNHKHPNNYGLGKPKIVGDELRYLIRNTFNVLNAKGNNNVFTFEIDEYTHLSLIGDLYVIATRETKEEFSFKLFNVDAGNIVWEKKTDKKWNFIGNIYSDYILSFINFDYKEVQCLNYLTGELVWSVDVTDWFVYQPNARELVKNQIRQLVVYENLVLVNMQGHLVAFEVETGKKVWQRNLEQIFLTVQYYFILDDTQGHIWVITASQKHRKGVLKRVDAQTGKVLWAASEPWEVNHQEPNLGDRWWWHFSMNSNFIFLTFESGFIGVMDKKTGGVVEWFRFSKRAGAVNHGHKLLNKTLYQPTDYEFLAIDVSAYFVDGDTLEVNSRDD